MYKSPSSKQTMQKKSSINFVRNLVSPKSGKGSQFFSTASMEKEHDFSSIDRFRKDANSNILILELSIEWSTETFRRAFNYNNDTPISELIEFVKREIGEEMVYFHTKNLNMDYLLTLGTRKVSEITARKLDIYIAKIKIIETLNPLKNLQILKCIGTGGFSKVYLARGYGQILAVKVISKSFIISNDKQNIIENQKLILEHCNDHPFITKLLLSFQTDNYLIFCMEYCNGGELFNLLRKVRRMKEEEAKFYFVQTLCAIAHLHSKKILYRDLKPENIIIDEEGHIRLADYGLSKVMSDDLTYSFCGSAEYMAPQMLLKKGHSFEVDYYCLGALLYELVIGLPPYYSRNQSELFQNIINNDLQFPENVQMSKELKKFLHRLLEKNTDIRFKKVQQIFDHPWLKGCNVDEILQKKLDPPFRTNMFDNNFDDTDFALEEAEELAKIEQQKEIFQFNELVFEDFFYQCPEITQLKIKLSNQETKFDFSKHKQSSTEQFQYQKELTRNKSSLIIGGRYMNQNNNFNFQKSARKANNCLSNQRQNNVISPKQQIFVQSGHIPFIKSSERINSSKIMHQPKSIPYIDKNSQYISGAPKMTSPPSTPINISNYINIYTNKAAPAYNHYLPQPTLPKKIASYANLTHNSIDKGLPINNSAYKQSHSMERVKFCSLDKPVTATFLRNNVYYQNNPNQTQMQRGYLSNFKDRFNVNPKIKKSYRMNEKPNFNFMSPNFCYKS